MSAEAESSVFGDRACPIENLFRLARSSVRVNRGDGQLPWNRSRDDPTRHALSRVGLAPGDRGRRSLPTDPARMLLQQDVEPILTPTENAVEGLGAEDLEP